jgi:hypothetical protein
MPLGNMRELGVREHGRGGKYRHVLSRTTRQVLQWQASLERPYLMPTFRSNKKSPGGLGRGFEFGVVSNRPKVSQEGRRINKVASSRLSVAKCVSTALI